MRKYSMPWFIYLSNSAEGFPCHSILGSQEHTENPKTYVPVWQLEWKKAKSLLIACILSRPSFFWKENSELVSGGEEENATL